MTRMPSSETVAAYHRTRAWVFFVLYCGVIFFLSHQPGNPNYVPPFRHFDKLVHFVEYMVFAIFLSRALAYSGRKRTIGIVLGVSLLRLMNNRELEEIRVALHRKFWKAKPLAAEQEGL